MGFLHDFALAFIPMFVAIDPVGILPLYLTFTRELDGAARRKVTLQAMITALGVALGFMFVGKAFLNTMGITIADFQIAGGVLLLVISVADMVSPAREVRDPGTMDDAGIVPLGIPLIAGPALLTTELLLLQQYGALVTASAVIANLALAGVGFLASDRVVRVLGNSGIKGVSKIVSLLLAAIAVMMIRIGFESIVRGFSWLPEIIGLSLPV